MNRRQALQVGSIVWVVAGGAVALGSLSEVNSDARIIVGLASVIGPLLGVGAALLLARQTDRAAGVLLVVSALMTPTYMAYAINIPALIVGGILAMAPHWMLPEESLDSRYA